MTTAPTARGLENVVITSSKLSAINGTAGELSYVGYNIHDLAERASFEEVCYLLWHGELPNAEQLNAFTARLVAERALSAEEAALVRSVPSSGHGMDALRTLVSGVAQLDPALESMGAQSQAEAERVGTRLLAKMPTLIAAWDRLRHDKEPVAPDPKLGHAANFLYMLHGERPGDTAARAFNTYLVLLAEHGLNASTFAGRVAIGAGADVYCGIVAAIATLKGVLHGGANQKAMETFLAIGTPDNAAPFIDALLGRHERLMGVGHRIYKVEDPRARHLRAAVEALGREGDPRPQAIADAVAQVVAEHPRFTERKLAPNVEFYSAPLLYMAGVPLDLFTCAFALSRMAGWTAHIREQIADNRLIRPKADYVGPAPRAFVPLAER